MPIETNVVHQERLANLVKVAKRLSVAATYDNSPGVRDRIERSISDMNDLAEDSLMKVTHWRYHD